MTTWDDPRGEQKRNRFWFTVTWPADLPADHEFARSAGTSYRASYPTRDAADFAARGFEERGADVV
jgi:hypothetical protein